LELNAELLLLAPNALKKLLDASHPFDVIVTFNRHDFSVVGRVQQMADGVRELDDADCMRSQLRSEGAICGWPAGSVGIRSRVASRAACSSTSALAMASNSGKHISALLRIGRVYLNLALSWMQRPP
jgi:hypothetical protein